MPHQYIEGDEPVPGYRLLKFIGEGGFGKVWKTAAPGGTQVAMKIIRLGGIQGRKEFRSLQLVKLIRHPNLVPVYAFWLKNDDGELLDNSLTDREDLSVTPAVLRGTIAAPTGPGALQPAELIIAMGLGDKSLFDRLEECRAEGREGIPAEELLGYMEDAAEAIDFLNRPVHDLGSGAVAIQHCDIKPHNIMIVGGSVQICDFGLSRVMGSVRATTATAGTIAYAAPECLKDGKPSHSTDQYSLAVSYYELRTGMLPYPSETFAAVTSAVLSGKLDIARLPSGEREVIRKATAVDPSKRFGSAKEMVRALCTASAQAGAPVCRTRRRRAPLAVAAVVAACAGVAAIGYWYSRPAKIAAERGGRQPVPTIESPVASASPLGAPGIEKAATLGPGIGGGGGGGEVIESLRARIGQLLHEADNEAAIESATKAIELAPKDASLYRLRGTARLALNQWEGARGDFDSAIRLGGNDEDLVGRGRAMLGLDVLDRAIADFDEALNKNPQNADAHLYRGAALTKQQQFDRAIADFEAARRTPGYENRPDYAGAYLGRGTDRYRNGDYAGAAADFETGTGFDPKDFRLFSRLGAVYYVEKEWDKAVAASSKAIELKPGDLDYINRGRGYQKLNRHDLAFEDFQKAIESNPKNAEAHYFLAEELLFKKANKEEDRLKQLTEAVREYTAAIADYSPEEVSLFNLPHAYFWRGSCARLLGHLDDAEHDFDAALKLPDANTLDPPDPIAEEFARLAADFAKARRLPDAAKWMQKAADLASDSRKQEEYRRKLKEYAASTT